MSYDKQLLIETLRKNLGISLGILIDDAEKLANKKTEESAEQLESLRSIKLEDIFNCTSINSPEQCLDELIKRRHLIKEKSISEIQEMLKCDLKIIIKTIKSLREQGGLKGHEIECSGIRRGMKYTLKEVEKNTTRKITLIKPNENLSKDIENSRSTHQLAGGASFLDDSFDSNDEFLD